MHIKPTLILLLSISYIASAYTESTYPESYINKLINEFEKTQVIAVKDIKPGNIKTVKYGDFKIHVYRRTPEDINYLKKYSTPKIVNNDEIRWKEMSKLMKPGTLSNIQNYVIRESQKQFSGLPFRSLKNDIFVVIASSPRVGCYVQFLPSNFRKSQFEIFMNRCHGQHYDSAGREISETGIPLADGNNLFIPPYSFNNDNLVLGGISINRKKAQPIVSYQDLTNQEKLWLACHNNDYSVVFQALSDGADPNLEEESGNALDYAITGSDYRIIKLLLSNGAQPTQVSRDIANISKRPDVLLLLDELGK